MARIYATNIKGFDSVLRNLNKEIKGIKDRSMSGLIESAILIRRDMDITPPIIPIDTGTLRASWYTQPFRFAFKIGIVMGFTANYAMIVHERTDPGINWKRPGSGPKFFEASIKRNISNILSIMKLKISIPTATGERVGKPYIGRGMPSRFKK